MATRLRATGPCLSRVRSPRGETFFAAAPLRRDMAYGRLALRVNFISRDRAGLKNVQSWPDADMSAGPYNSSASRAFKRSDRLGFRMLQCASPLVARRGPSRCLDECSLFKQEWTLLFAREVCL